MYKVPSLKCKSVVWKFTFDLHFGGYDKNIDVTGVVTLKMHDSLPWTSVCRVSKYVAVNVYTKAKQSNFNSYALYIKSGRINYFVRIILFHGINFIHILMYAWIRIQIAFVLIWNSIRESLVWHQVSAYITEPRCSDASVLFPFCDRKLVARILNAQHLCRVLKPPHFMLYLVSHFAPELYSLTKSFCFSVGISKVSK